MRLYLFCRYCRNKIYLTTIVSTRNQLLPTFELQCPFCGTRGIYCNYEVFAETSSITGLGGAVVGGLIGLLIGGPLGVLLGGLGGGAIGTGAEESDKAAVERFNRS